VHEGRHVEDRDAFRCDVVAERRIDHQHAEQPATHLLVRHLVRVVPVGSDLIGYEAVDKSLTRCDGVLGDPRDAVHRSGHVDSVPVQGHPVLDVLVQQPDLDELALPGPDERTGCGAVERVSVDLAPGGQGGSLPPGDEVHHHVGRPRRIGDHIRDRDSAPAGHAADGLGHAAVVGVPLRHHAVRAREQTVRP